MEIKKLSEIRMIQLGNRKLPDTTGIFNLPSHKTCLGKTDFCSEHCYALKAERMYPSCKPFREMMLTLSWSDQFVEMMNAEISFLYKKGKINTIRIHESGDYYNQKYLDKWFAIALSNPDVMFYSYTKSFSLDFTRKPKNFIVFYSTDHTTKYPMPEGIENEAFTSMNKCPTNSNIMTGFKLCWDFKKNDYGKCKTCNYCYTNPEEKKNVVFFLH